MLFKTNNFRKFRIIIDHYFIEAMHPFGRNSGTNYLQITDNFCLNTLRIHIIGKTSNYDQ